MAYYIFRGTDRPGTQELRAALRDEHRAYIRRPAPDCRTILGGPLLTEPAKEMYASLLVFEATDRAAVVRYLADDPYARAGLFASTQVDLWLWGLGQPEPAGADQRG
jgi:uncharacterized protein